MNLPDTHFQTFIVLRTRRRWPFRPRIVPAAGDTQHPAHRGQLMIGLIRFHELEDFGGIELVSRANQAVAFAKMSRSSRT